MAFILSVIVAAAGIMLAFCLLLAASTPIGIGLLVGLTYGYFARRHKRRALQRR